MVSLIDVRLLFQTQSIEEINIIEKGIRGEIEKKKDDLRVMVGERYRDLINAADTIKDMELASSKVFSGIKNIQSLCASFHSSLESSCSSQINITQSPRDVAFYSLATQMDLLVNTPEKIWSALDNHEYLNATELYMFSHHIVNKSLNILVDDSKTSGSRDVYASFPVLHHQWAAISHFKASILKGAEYSLKDKTLPDKKLCESLCSLALLDCCSPRQVFMALLTARKAAIQDVFRSNIYATSVKKQIFEIAYILKLTIEQIATLFYADEEHSEKSMFYSELSQITDERSSNSTALKTLFDREITSTIAPYLPESVAGFVPKLRTAPVPISMQYIQEHVMEWFQNCSSDIQSGVKMLLPYVNNIKGLSAIQDGVFNLLQSDSVISEENSWFRKCQICFGKPISIWDEIFRPVFVAQTEIIIGKHLQLSFDDLEKQLELSLNALQGAECDTSEASWDHDLVSFVWHDFPQDFSNLIDDKLGGCDRNFLSMKIKCFTPSLKNICLNFDSSLLNILQDIHFLINDGANQNPVKQEVVKLQDSSNTIPFDKYAYSTHLVKETQEYFLKHVESLCACVKNSLSILENQLIGETSLEKTILLIDKVVYLGRFCLALPDLCPSLEKIFNYDTDKKKSIKVVSSRSTSFKIAEDKFKNQAMDCFQLWIKWLHRMCSSLLKETLDSEENYGLLSTTHWEDILIEEEGETGAVLKSRVKVPVQVSFYLSSLLFRIVEEFHRIGGNSMDKSSIEKLKTGIALSIVNSHESFLSEQADNIFQYRVLQMLFDVKFIIKLFINESKVQDSPETSQLRTSVIRLVKSLEQHVDPFDLDVFTPHIELNVQKYFLKTTLIYGSISSIEKHSSQTLTSQEQHSVVKMVDNPPRFMLLPMSARVKDADDKICTDIVENVRSPLFVHQTSVIS